MRALFDDPAALEQRDPVGERDRRGTVGDHQRRPALHHGRQRRADLVLLRRVDGRGGVVENEHRGIGEDRARDRNALALPARQREATLAEHGVVSVREVGDELGRSCKLSRPRDFLVRCVGRAKRMFSLTVSVKRKVSSNTSATACLHVAEPEVAHVVAVQEDGTVVRVVQACKQARDRALSRSGRADERQRLAGSDVQLEAVENRVVVVMAELHAGQADVPPHRMVELDGMPRLCEPRLCLEHFADASARADRLLQCRHALPEHAQRPDEVGDVGVEGEEGAEGQVALRSPDVHRARARRAARAAAGTRRSA